MSCQLGSEESEKCVSTASNKLRQDLSLKVEIPLKEGEEPETVRLVL